MQSRHYWHSRLLMKSRKVYEVMDMDIVVRNPPASGANFSDNTNKSILCYAEFIKEAGDVVAPFSQFREDVSKTMGTNIKNDRTIYPMLKYLGLISYEKGEDLHYQSFFTKTGDAYVNALHLKEKLEESQRIDPNNKNIQNGLIVIQKMLHEIVLYGLQHLFTHYDNDVVSYRKYLINLISFLLKFDSIDKKEFAYLSYAYANGLIRDTNFANTIKHYRSGDLDFNIIVDAYDKNKGGSVRKKATGANLTAYGYHMSMLAGAGIIEKKQDGRFYMVPENRVKISSIIEQLGENDVL